MNLFYFLYIGCQNRDGNLDEFFQHENQAFPPTLSDGGDIGFDVNRDFLTWLEDFSHLKSKVLTSFLFLDKAAIIQLLRLATAKAFNEYAQQVFVP